MSNLKLEKRLVHNPYMTTSLGCVECPERLVCGGLQVTANVFDCMSFCQCNGEVRCNFVCRNNTEHFVMSCQEIRGFDFDNIPRSRPLPQPDLPFIASLLYHGSRRENRLQAKAVAIKMTDIADYKLGCLKYKSKERLAEHFKFDINAKLIITGVDQDRFIEPYWTGAHQGKIIDDLCALGADLVTVPNFSLFLEAPRWDNLHNMKRILICWNELVSRGVQTSLHLNARTDRDWERLTDFIGQRDEVASVALEFGTGLARKDRGKWHTEKSLALAEKVGRPLHLVLRGGVKYLREFSSGFSSVTLLDSSAFSKTRSRRQLVWGSGKPDKWKAIRMEEYEPLDDLLQFNVDQIALKIAHQSFH